VSWTGAAVDGSKVIEAGHKFGVPDGGWEIFTDAQIATIVAAAQAICGEFDIEEILGHDDIAPGRKSHPGPAWDMNAFKARVRGEADLGDAVMVVRSSNGLNIRQGPGASFPTVTEILTDGTKVMVHEASGKWRSVLTPAGESPIFGLGPWRPVARTGRWKGGARYPSQNYPAPAFVPPCRNRSSACCLRSMRHCRCRT
jgi:N-acetylmuramoyl-L-alanine amidase